MGNANSNSAYVGFQGNENNLLKGADGLRTGTGTCKSDTLDLFQRHWVRTNTTGVLAVIFADRKDDTPVNVLMTAGIASEFKVRRIMSTGSAAIAVADIVLLS